MAKPNQKWVTSRFPKEELHEREVEFCRNGQKLLGTFDILGPNKKGLLEITIQYSRKTDEETLTTTRFKLSQSEADRIEINRFRILPKKLMNKLSS